MRTNTSQPLLLLTALLLAAAAARGAGAPWVSGAPDRADPVSYGVGDAVEWTFRADALPPSAAGKKVGWSWTVAGDGPAATGTAPYVAGEPLVVTNVFSAPGFLRASATLVDAERGKPLRADGGVAAAASGAGADPLSLEQPDEPADFDAFWRAAKAEIEDPALPRGSLAPPSDGAARMMPGFRIASFLVPLGPGRRPAAGWVAWPAAASEGTLPMVVHFGDYGIGPSDFPAADFVRGVLFVCIQPHGFTPDMDRQARIEAYTAMSDGATGGAYGFRDAETADPRTCYFRGLVQRALAAIRLGRSLPMWDGEHVRLQGRGQGAFLAVACAAVDGGATELKVSAPWLCGLGLDTSWQPTFQPALRYYDAAVFARRVRCPARIEADLTDTAHAPAAAARLFAALAGPKTLVFRQREGGEAVSTFAAEK